MARKVLPAVLGCIFLFYFCLFFLAGPSPVYASGNAANAKKAILEVFEYLHRAHISQPKADQLLKGAVRGMIDTLNDPYTEYLSEDELEKLAENLGGVYGGIGVYLEARPDYPRVQEVFSGSPAMKAGLQVGDKIIKVDGTDIKGWSLPAAVEKIKGPAGTEVVLVIDRGGKEISIKLKRAHLDIPTIESKVVGKNTGYIAVKTFGVNTPGLFREHLDTLMSQHIGGLVIDLRDNPGGYMDAALEMVEIFLDPEAPIVITRYYDGSVNTHLAGKEVKRVKVPVVALINSQSASSSEIMVGALRDNGIATLVGERSFGKGTAQSLIRLDTGGALKLTTAEYTTPKGTKVHNQGLKPDYEVHIRSLQLPFALGILESGPKEIVFTSGKKEVAVDGNRITATSAPLINERGVYLPLRFTLEALGYVVAWEQDSAGISARKRDVKIFMPVEGYPFLNGREIKAGGSVIIEDGISYISLELIEQLGHAVKQHDDRIVIKG